MFGWEQGQVSLSLGYLLGVLPDSAVVDMHPEPLGRSQAVAAHRQSQDLLAGQACTAPVKGCEWAAGQNGDPLGLDAGDLAGLTLPGR